MFLLTTTNNGDHLFNFLQICYFESVTEHRKHIILMFNCFCEIKKKIIIIIKNDTTFIVTYIFLNSNTNIRELVQKVCGNDYTLVCNKCL